MVADKKHGDALTDFDALRGIIDAVPHPIFVKDERHRFVLLNQSMCELMGHPFEALVGHGDHDFVPKDQADIYLVNDQRVLDTGEMNENEEWFTGGDNTLRTIITRKKRLVLSNGARLIVGCITDISAFRHAEAQIRHNAEHDHLTGLANRSLFRWRLREIMAGGPRDDAAAAVLIVDLDGFKNVNDVLGHAAGDNLLVQVAATLSGLVGSRDLVARLGGDEFAIIQQEVGQPEAATALAAKIVDRLSRPQFVANRQARVSASVGIAVLHPVVEEDEAILRQADLALYRAKGAGRNGWALFEAEMEASYLVTRVLEADLATALQNDGIGLALRPIVRVANREAVAYRAIPDWQHPTRGAVAPALIAAVAESADLNSSLCEFLVRAACREAARLPGHTTVAVELSQRQFGRADLPFLVASAAAAADIDVHRIAIETSEPAILIDAAHSAETIARLRKIGAQVVIAGFGGEQSSLYGLTHIALDGVRLDRGLVADAERGGRAELTLAAVISFARILGLTITAAGVDSDAQLAMLARLNCDCAEGPLFGDTPAVDAPAVTRLKRPA